MSHTQPSYDHSSVYVLRARHLQLHKIYKVCQKQNCALTMPVQVSISLAQCPKVVRGATTRKGPRTPENWRWYSRTAIDCAVLPRPICMHMRIAVRLFVMQQEQKLFGKKQARSSCDDCKKIYLCPSYYDGVHNNAREVSSSKSATCSLWLSALEQLHSMILICI